MSNENLIIHTAPVCSLSDKQLLQDLLNSDIMNSDVVKQQLNMIKKDKVLAIHEYMITEPKDETSRWQTYIKKDGKRSKVSAMDEQGLYEKLYEFYFQKNLSLKMIYSEWIQKRRTSNVSARTIRRNENHWDKYYQFHNIIKIPLRSITTDMLEKFFHEKIKEYNLTLKELNNMKFIMKDMLKMSKRKGYISKNPFNDIEINTNACKPPNKQNDVSRIYLPTEQKQFFNALEIGLESAPYNTDYYAICLLFKLGLRIGELCALQWSDINFETSEIHIHRMETQDANENGDMEIVVVPYTKKRSSFGDRFLPLGEYELDILEKVKEINQTQGFIDGDFIFCDRNGRSHLGKVDSRIRIICRQAKIIPEKSAHDIRRTVATQMYMQGISIDIIKEFLGHSDTKTTWGYIVNNQEKEVVHSQIKNALANLNGLKRTHVS